jgi:hypothetical protein
VSTAQINPSELSNKRALVTEGPKVWVVFLCTDAANRMSGACLDAVAGESAKWTD